MSEREYIVSLHRNIDCAAFDAEMVAHTGTGAIPCRCVDIANARPGSQRNTHYMLTDQEADLLRSDPRVMGVEIPPEQRDDLVIGLRAIQTGDFSKTTEDRGFFINWGLRRCNEAINPYSGSTVTGGYNYTLDGTGVDIIVHDTGIEANHPEWQDYQGVSRLQQIDWYTASGLPGTMPAGHYTDYHGHGTHVGATAAGKTYGWAKNARVYAIKIAGLEGPTDPNSGIPIADCFDVIKEWHNSKPIDPATGAKRPTIVNMSWGYQLSWTTVSQINYRGVAYSGAAIDTVGEIAAFGLIAVSNGVTFLAPTRVPTVDVDIEELIDAGVHVTIASGNNFHKIDVVGGVDYNNNAITNAITNDGTGTINYHRGSSPYSVDAHMVGNIDSAVHSGGLEQKAQSSCTGPGVSIYAPGTNIMAAVSNVNVFTDDGPYPDNTNFKISNISGTSMAAPQIAGILALYTQLNPGATPLQARTFLNNISQSDQLFDTELNNDYANFRSLSGGANRFAFNKFNSAVQLRIGSEVQQPAPPAAATYALSTSSASVNEGSSFTITLTTTNVANGTAVPYTITGVSSADIGGASLTGNFTVNNNTATLVVNVTADLTTEGTEVFTLTLNFLSVSQTVTINDTSTTPVIPTYAATPAANNINEGSALTINVATTNVDDATTLYYTVTNTGDFVTSSGSFTINSNTGSFTVTPAADAITEGAETFTVSIRTGSTSGTVVATTGTVTINDTSTTPAGTIYNVTVASGTNIYGPGNKYYIDGFGGPSPVLNLIEGETYVFRQSDSSNATHPLRFSTTADGTWGGGVEYTTGVTIVGTAGQLGSYTQITVAVGAPTLYYYCVNHSGMGGTANTPSAATPIYDSVTSPASANEGDTVTFTVDTQNVDNGTTVGYTITGIDANDLSAGSLTGNITINSNTGTVSVTLANDQTTEGTETMTLTLAATDSAGTSTGALSSSTTINDTSTTPVISTYAVTPTANNVNEGSSLTFNVATTNVDDTTTLYWTVTNAGDFATSSGSFTINSNAGSFSVTPTADLTTEGPETFTASIRTVSTSGTIVATSSTVTINDTSTTPVFTPDYTITVTNSGNNYLLTGSDRNGSFSSSSQPTLAFNNGDLVRFNVNAGTSSAHPFFIKTSQSTGTGNQVAGVTGQGTTQLDWTTATAGAGTRGYQCSIHFGMWRTITIS